MQPSASKDRLGSRMLAALRMTWEASPGGFALAGGMTLLQSTVAPTTIWLGKKLVDHVATGANQSQLVPVVLALGVLTAGQRVLVNVVNNRQRLLGLRVTYAAMRRFLAATSGLDLAYFEDPEWHDRMSRAQRDLAFRPFNLSWSLIGLAGSTITTIGMLGLLASLHPVLVLLALMSVVLPALEYRRQSRDRYKLRLEKTPLEREQQYLMHLLSDERPAKEIRSFGLAPTLLGRHAAVTGELIRAEDDLRSKADLRASVAGLIGGGLLAVAYWLVGARGAAGALTPGDLTVVMGAFAGLTMQASLLSSTLVTINEHSTFLRDYISFLAERPTVVAPADPIPVPERIDVTFDHVTFGYKAKPSPALTDVSFTIEPGQMLALVGENGAGKTTVVKLLLRFYDAQEGKVLVGGIDVRRVDPAELRSRIGVLFQDFMNFSLTARETIAFGRADEPADDERVWAALRAARAEGVIGELPDGLDSKVGKLFETGRDLSGGQWQRLALARLMYRDADIWILDEPTSNLDPEAEAAVFEELRLALHGRIGIVISHRFSTVRMADHIAVMQDGRITEHGTHDDLVARGGRYAQLFELQASGYR